MTTNVLPESAVPPELVARLVEARRLLLSSHANPDGDSVGSQLGLARGLRTLGKEAVVWNLDPPPAALASLDDAAAIHVGSDPPPGFPDAFDLVVILECPSLDRTGLEQHLADRPLLNIDHHLGNQHYGIVDWIDTTAAAVGVMVFTLLRRLGSEIDRETSDLLYLALVSDTGCFRFSNATPLALRAAAEMVEAGASPERVSERLYEQKPPSSLRLAAEVLHSLELHHRGEIATVAVTQEMYRRAGADRTDTEGLIDLPRSIAGVRAVALFREIRGGEYKVSLRSRGSVDVEAIARSHGGGGHRNAAGCLLSADLLPATRTIVDELIGVLDLPGR